MDKKFPWILELLNSKKFGVNVKDSDEIPDVDNLLNTLENFIENKIAYYGDFEKILNEIIPENGILELNSNGQTSFLEDLNVLHFPSEILQHKEERGQIIITPRNFKVGRKTLRNLIRTQPLRQVSKSKKMTKNATRLKAGIDAFQRIAKIRETANNAARLMAGNEAIQRIVEIREIANNAARLLAGNEAFQQIAKIRETANNVARLFAGNETFQLIAKIRETAKNTGRLLAENKEFQQIPKTSEMINKAMVDPARF